MKISNIYENSECCKFIYELDDGYYIENCFKYPYWICITTQVGCPIGCKFCQSGKMGYKRNLTKREILEQIELCLDYAIGEIDYELMFINISFSGMGEPLANIENVVASMDELLSLSDTKIGITTTGIKSNIQRLFFLQGKIDIDISAHSLDSKTRKILIPSEVTNPINDTIDYVTKYQERFSNITFDYLLLKGINDSRADLEKIIHKIKGSNIKVELKRYNSIENDVFSASDEDKFEEFYKILMKNNIKVIIEKNVGLELKAGCGQFVWSLNQKTL